MENKDLAQEIAIDKELIEKIKMSKSKVENTVDGTDELDDNTKKEYIIEVEFKGSRKGYYTNPKNLPLKVGGYVIVSFENGEDMGIVSAILNKAVIKTQKEEEDDGIIIRRCNQIDIRRLQQNRRIEDKILIDARKQAKGHGLEMKFLDIEYKFDRKKLVFFFTADGRVDFRELVKTFASEYRTRIELRQIGARDEAQRIGGVGKCGRELCCSKFLKEFVPINVSMARDQNLFIKPEKFSGLCSKLLCCLKYEHNFYKSQKKDLPDIGTTLITDKGDAFVTTIDIFAKQVEITYRNGENIFLKFDDFKKFLEKLPKENIIPPEKSGNGEDFSELEDEQSDCSSCDKCHEKKEQPQRNNGRNNYHKNNNGYNKKNGNGDNRNGNDKENEQDKQPEQPKVETVVKHLDNDHDQLFEGFDKEKDKLHDDEFKSFLTEHNSDKKEEDNKDGSDKRNFKKRRPNYHKKYNKKNDGKKFNNDNRNDRKNVKSKFKKKNNNKNDNKSQNNNN